MRSALWLLVPLLALDGPAQDAPASPGERRAPADPGEPYRERSLSGRATAADGKALAIGSGRYSFSTGRFWELAAKDGRPVGAFFVGHGSLSFTPADPQAARVAVRNARNVGGASAEDGHLQASFQRATFLFSGAMLPDWAFEKADGAPDAALKAHRDRFKDDRTPEVEAPLSMADAAKRRFFASTLEASRDLRHLFDDVTTDEETLTVVDRPGGLPLDFPDARFARILARQPIGRTRHEAPRVDARLVAVDVDVRENGKAWGLLKVTETFRVERPVSALALDFRTDAYVSSRYLKTLLLSVTDGDGTPLGHALSPGSLVVSLPRPAAAGAVVTLRLEYEAPFFESAGGNDFWELPVASGWYPQPSHGTSSSHTFRAVVRTRKPLLAFAPGETVRREEDGDWNLVETRLDRPVPFATVLAGAYTLQESTEDGITCRVASRGQSKELYGRKLLELFHGIRKLCAARLGPFPWKEYTILEVAAARRSPPDLDVVLLDQISAARPAVSRDLHTVNVRAVGGAPPGMMRLPAEALQPDSWSGLVQVPDRFSRGVGPQVARALAHGYFGDAVPMSEAFSEVVARSALMGMGHDREADQLAAGWRSAARGSTGAAPIHLANELASRISATGDSSTAQDRFDLVHSKGALLVDTLRRELGDELFFPTLRAFLLTVEKNPGVTADDFVDHLSIATKRDWKPWFARYYYGVEMPGEPAPR